MIRVDANVIQITQGNSGTVQFVFYDQEGKPLDLSNYGITFMVKQRKTDPNSKAIITKFYDEVEDCMIDVVLTKEDTAAPVGPYWWSILFEDGGYKNEALSGQFYIIEGVQD